MRVRFLAWFLFLLCTQSVTILGFEDYSTLKFEDSNLSKPKFGEQLHVGRTGINVTMELYTESDRRELKEKHEIFQSVKGQKGKGTYGGGNSDHHPRTNKGAAPLSASPCFLYSKAMLHLSLAVIGIFLPYFLTGF